MTEQQTRNRIIAWWLFLCCAMVFAMIVLGGLTRLTGSGLSMVEWDPIFGILPPLNEVAWQAVFDKYRGSPEYLHVNAGMDLEGFKSIYWFEYAHRLFGRTIGTVFLLPFLFFLWRGWIRRPLIPKLAALFVLGGLQGVLGWYMVMSGLVDVPHVSQYRLTAHLLLAVLIYAWMFWLGLDLYHDRADHRWRAGARFGWPAVGLILLTIASGGLVAGLKAGLAYNTFPLMDGRLLPEVMFPFEPWWRNFFDHVATVQFDHRLLALTTFTVIISGWLLTRRGLPPGRARRSLHLLGLMALIQVSLGIATLLQQVPVALASAHQAGAILLLTLAIIHLHGLTQTAPEGTGQAAPPDR